MMDERAVNSETKSNLCWPTANKHWPALCMTSMTSIIGRVSMLAAFRFERDIKRALYVIWAAVVCLRGSLKIINSTRKERLTDPLLGR